MNYKEISFAEKLEELLMHIDGEEEDGEYFLRNDTSHSIVESNTHRLVNFGHAYCKKS